MTIEEVMDWLRRNDGRIEDIFGLWVQGKRDDRWVADKLIAEGHIAALRSGAEVAAAEPRADEGFVGHKPLPNGRCEHRWRNRTTHVVRCRYADGWHAGQVALITAGAEVPPGTMTECPLVGVHEHAFRGPHRFREWEPGT